MQGSSILSSSFVSFYDPDFYDMKVGPGSRVGELYRQYAVEQGGPILELGCGTGDILFAIARESIKVCGLDGSPAMLAKAKNRLESEMPDLRPFVNLVQGRIEQFNLSKTFKQILLTNDVIAHLLQPEDILGTFRSCFTHLRPGGRLVLDISQFDICYLARYSDPGNSVFRHRGTFQLVDSHSIQVWERSTYDLSSEILSAHFRYEKMNGAGRIMDTFERILYLRPRKVTEVQYALLACGFSGVQTRLVTRSEGESATLITCVTPQRPGDSKKTSNGVC